MADQLDLVVIGSGTGGYVAAIRAAQLGLRVAVVEREKTLGGTCLNWGCIPTKALLEHAHALKIAQQTSQWGLTLGDGPVGIDLGQVQARKDGIVSGLTTGIEFLFKKNKIEWLRGTGTLRGNGRVDVEGSDGRHLQAREIMVATGSAPRSVPGIEIDRTRIITSDQAIGLREIPRSMVVLGSGAVGVEFASIYRRFGAEVTIVELLPRLVPLEDEAISTELQRAFKKQGIAVRTGARMTSATPGPDGVRMEITAASGAVERLEAEYLLVATGRGPVTSGLGAEEAGLQLESGYVRVNERFETAVPHVSAIGDVITLGRPGHPQLAHLSSAEGVAAAERIAGRPFRPLDYDQVPTCTYCDPEIGSVGLTEREAGERGYDVAVGRFPFSVLGRARISGETDGFVKIVADTRYDEVLGVHMIGPRATELVAEATLAIRLECTVEELSRTIHAHPTMSEAVGEAAHAVRGAAIHI